MCPSRNTWKRKPNGYKDLKENNLAISHPIFGPSLNLEAAVGSQKSAQALGAPGTIQKGLITTEVTTTFCIAPCTPISYTSFLRPTAVSRLNGPQSKHPQHSCAMSRIFLNRFVQICPKSWRDMVQVIFFQVLTIRVVAWFAHNILCRARFLFSARKRDVWVRPSDHSKAYNIMPDPMPPVSFYASRLHA